MPEIICVRAAQAVWEVECAAPGFPRVFDSGGAAEQAAIHQAEQRAAAGAPTEVRLFLRDGSLAGRFLVCAPSTRIPLPAA